MRSVVGRSPLATRLPPRLATASGAALALGVALLLAPAGAVTAATSAGPVYALVANSEGGSVTVVDTASNSTAATIAVGSGPTGVAITPDGSRAYVGTASSVSVLDTVGLAVTATIPVSRASRSVAISPDGKYAYVSGQESNQVSVIDTATNAVTAVVPVPGAPIGLAVSPDSDRVYVSSYRAGTVSVIDTATHTVTAAIQVGPDVQDVALSPDGTELYVVVQGQSRLAVLDTATNTRLYTVAVGASPFGVTVAPGGGRVYVVNQGAGSVSVIDPAARAVVGTIGVGSNPLRVAFTSDGDRAYVTRSSAASVSVIDTATQAVVGGSTTGRRPYGIAVVPSAAARVTAHPADQQAHVGDTATFTAEASGNPVPSVQWQSAPPRSSTFTDIDGANSPSYTTPRTTPLDDGTQYRAVFSNTTAGTVNTATTDAAVLTVTAGPAVTKQPAAQAVTAGSAATFTAAASGTPQPTVQWQSAAAGSEAFTDIAGATATTYTTPATAEAEDGTRYRARFTNLLGSATSDEALLSVQVAPSFQSGAALPRGQVGTPYSATIPVSGRPAPTGGVMAGALPPGLSLTGGPVLSGTPTAPGRYRFVLRATNAAGRADRTFTVTIDSALAPQPVPPEEPEVLPVTGSGATGLCVLAVLLLLAGGTGRRWARSGSGPSAA